MANQTIERFGYPGTLIREFEHWVVVLRMDQVTLGSLVLCAKSDATAFAALPQDAFTEMATVVAEIEAALTAAFQYDRINYVMLMMIDPNVHFHVLPRYENARSACGVSVTDAGWPGAPMLAEARSLNEAERDALIAHLSGFWQ
jgi:diadenosine tetraphosphate (Ap4A) HIT family hydrolase